MAKKSVKISGFRYAYDEAVNDKNIDERDRCWEELKVEMSASLKEALQAIEKDNLTKAQKLGKIKGG
jgi:hypothetical protein